MNDFEEAKLNFDKEESKKRVRQRCIEFAIHSNNASYCTPEKILEEANKFLNFIEYGSL